MTKVFEMKQKCYKKKENNRKDSGRKGPIEVELHDKALRRSTREWKENVYLKEFIQWERHMSGMQSSLLTVSAPSLLILSLYSKQILLLISSFPFFRYSH